MPQSRSIAEYLATLPNIEPRLWPDFFEPGLLTLEAIDLMLTKVSGGVLVATPDEQNSKGQFFPTANVVFELGVLSARIGRPNVALCTYDGVEIPTDLRDFTHIDMGPCPSEPHCPSPPLSEHARMKLQRWCRSLQDTPEGVPRTEVLHGYSGLWNVRLRFLQWRDIVVADPNSVALLGKMTLVLPQHGAKGWGHLRGLLSAHLRDPPNSRRPCDFEVIAADTIEGAICHADGTLDFQSKTFSRHLKEKLNSESWNIGDLNRELPGANHFRWRLCIDPAESLVLRGTMTSEPDGRTTAEACFHKEWI